MGTPDFIEHLDFLRKEIDKALKKLPIKKKSSEFEAPIMYALKGKGKRIRPILTHLTGKAFEADPEAVSYTHLTLPTIYSV